MNDALRLTGNVLRLGLVALLGAGLALALYPLWDIETRWLIATVIGVFSVALAMCLVHVFSDFLLIVCLFCLPVMSFHKWFWPDRYGEEERGNLVYSGMLGLGLLDFILLGLYLSWFYRVFVTREQPPPRWNLVDSAILWFVIAHFAASLGAPAPDLALAADEYLLKFVLFYVYASRHLTGRLLPWLAGALAATILIEATLGSVQFATGKLVGIALDKGAGGSELNAQYAVPGLEGVYRATGTSYDSHSLGHFIAMMLPFPLVLSFTPRLKPRLRLLCIVVAALAALTILLSLSRSAWVAVAISLALGIVLIITVWRERQVIPALAMGVVLLALAAPVAGGFIYNRFANAPAEVLGTRFDQYRVALAIIGYYPFFGNGPGNWFESLRMHDFLSLEDILPVHNVLLWITADLGFFGVAAYLAIFAAAMARLIPVLRRRRDLGARLCMATLLALVTSLLDGLTDPTFREPNVFTMFWLLVALSVALPELPPETGAAYMVSPLAPAPPGLQTRSGLQTLSAPQAEAGTT